MSRWGVAGVLVSVLVLSGCAEPPLPSSTPAPGEPYSDVRGTDLADSASVDPADIPTLMFNEATLWPEQCQEVASVVLEQGKNPGLGVRQLHARGITGQGVTVAIIDQNLVGHHPEYTGKIIQYHDVGTGHPLGEGSMHGPAVASLLVGEQIGTAPGARLYYVAAPSWTADAQYQADALDWLVDQNETLPPADKIRVVSVSAAPSGPGTVFTRNTGAWDEAYQRAMDAGILVLDCTAHHGLTAPCSLDLTDPENPAKCTPGWPGLAYRPMKGRIHVPTSRRTEAEEYQDGEFGYQYTGRGGSSWSVPYLAGVLALGWQVRPELTAAELLQLIFETAYIRADGARIINPPAFVEAVERIP